LDAPGFQGIASTALARLSTDRLIADATGWQAAV
jgi:hypothetical protein